MIGVGILWTTFPPGLALVAQALRPDDQGIAANLKRALEAAGLAQPDRSDTIQVPSAIIPKDAFFEIDVESFYWLE